MYKTFNDIINNEIEKFNPYHDKAGRFCGPNGASFMTFRTIDPKKQYLADKAKERAKQKSEEQKNKQVKISDVKTGDWKTLKEVTKSSIGAELSDDVIEKLDFDMVKATIEGIDGVVKMFPQIKGEIKAVKTEKDNRTIEGTYKSNGEIVLNETLYDKNQDRAFKNIFEDLADEYGFDLAGRFMPKNTISDPFVVGAHEAGHAVWDHVLLDTYGITKEDYEAAIQSNEPLPPDMRAYRHDWNKCINANKFVSKCAKVAKKTPEAIGEDGKRKSVEQLKLDISDYAATSGKGDETIAEAIADSQKNGDEAQILSRLIVGSLKELIK